MKKIYLLILSIISLVLISGCMIIPLSSNSNQLIGKFEKVSEGDNWFGSFLQSIEFYKDGSYDADFGLVLDSGEYAIKDGGRIFTASHINSNNDMTIKIISSNEIEVISPPILSCTLKKE